MSESVLGDLVSVLDLVVLERLPGGAMYQVGDQPAPGWFAEHFRGARQPDGRREPVTLLQAFPVLDAFLSEAEIFWERTEEGRLEGEAVVVTESGGENLPLATIAVSMKKRRFLILQRVAGFDDRQHILQIARDRALEQGRVVKRIQALHRPVATLTRLAGELSGTDLTESQRKQMAGIATEVDTLRRLLEELPQMPKGVSARQP